MPLQTQMGGLLNQNVLVAVKQNFIAVAQEFSVPQIMMF